MQKLITILQKELFDAEFEALAAKGRAMAMKQALAYVLENQDFD